MTDRINEWLLQLLTRNGLMKAIALAILAVPSVVIAYGTTRASGISGLVTILVVYVVVGTLTIWFLRRRIWPTRFDGDTSRPPPVSGTEYASSWRRFSAFLIDFIVVFIVSRFVASAVTGGATDGHLFNVAHTTAAAIYFSIGNYYGTTLGKWLIRIRIVGGGGLRPGLRSGLIRSAANIVAIPVSAIAAAPHTRFATGYIYLLFEIGFATLIWDANKQSVYDHMAGTFVLAMKPRTVQRQVAG
jgi:uncharacterized RDD family membrane protein YckC